MAKNGQTISKYKLQVQKWRKRYRETLDERTVLAGMIDHIGDQINEYFPDTIKADACYGDIADEAVRKIAELKRMRDVRDKSEETETKSN